MPLAMARPSLHPKSGVYRIRRVVPPELRGINGLGENRIISLRTKDPKEARARASAVNAKIDAEFALARAAVQPARSLTYKETVALCGEWYRDFVPFFDEEPGSAGDWEDFASLIGDRLDAVAAHGEVGIAAYPGDVEAARTFLAVRGIAADVASIRRFAAALAQTKIKAAQVLAARARGDYSPDPHLATFPAMPGTAPGDAREALTAEAALALWAVERNPSAATLKAYAGKFRRFAEVLGFDDLRRITADDVVKIKQARLAAGISGETVRDDIVTGSTLCRWLAKNRYLPSNPFQGLAPEPIKRGEAPVAPFSDDEAKRILTAARKEQGWLRWSSWILCFTGARVSEIAELRRRDVREYQGTLILDMVPLAPREGKNNTFQRMIPLHPALIAEGFLDYVAGLPADPAGPLFPDLRPDPRGSRVIPGGTKAVRWLRNVVGIKDDAKHPNHSWRHRIQDEFRKVRAPDEVVDAITGRHNPRNAGAGYGKGFRGMPEETLKDLAKMPSPAG